MNWPRLFPLIISVFVLAATARALNICLPTANDALLRPGGDADYFQPTVEGTVESGMFGCVRSKGRRFHEGIDIKCLQHNWDTVSVCTLYAHLSEIAAGLVVDQPVKKGQIIATMGHSTNTREGIS